MKIREVRPYMVTVVETRTKVYTGVNARTPEEAESIVLDSEFESDIEPESEEIITESVEAIEESDNEVDN
jgi:hypothetical protein